MRFNRLGDLGLSNDQIKEFLIFGEKKVGDTMVNAMNRDDAELWFGIVPPDLSVIARSRGPDWLYTYLRSFYQDDKSTTGWNNTLFPNVGMPHILWELQGIREVEAGEASHVGEKIVTKTEGALNQTQYDSFVRDLVNYLVFIGGQENRCNRYCYLVCVKYFSCSYLGTKKNIGKTLTNN